MENRVDHRQASMKGPRKNKESKGEEDRDGSIDNVSERIETASRKIPESTRDERQERTTYLKFMTAHSNHHL